VFNIEKLINTICKPIKSVYLSECTGTYLNKMCIEEYTLI
jgi:hypothetical protein